MGNARFLNYMQAYGRWVCDFFLDFRYGGYFGGKIKSRYAHLGARETSSSNYSVLSCIFRKYKITDSDILVDLGCGKGRVINWWLKQGYKNRIIGLEINEQIAAETGKRFQRYRNVEIICGNALEKIPECGTVFYLYNSFARRATNEFRDRMKNLFGSKGVKIIYVCCEQLEAFSGDPDWKICTNAGPFFKNVENKNWDKLHLPTSYPIALIELRTAQ